MKITIIGAGHTGLAAACYFFQQQVPVCIYTRSNAKASLIKGQGLKAEGRVEGTFFIPATTDLQAAMDCADLILISTWANDHRSVFEALRGRLHEGQTLLVLNSNWGAAEGWQILGEELATKNIVLGETASQPFLGAYDGGVSVNVKAIKEEVNVAGIRERDSARLKLLLEPFFKHVGVKANVLETSLSSTNPVIHLPIAVFNLQRIEGAVPFRFLSEVTPHVVAYIEKIDAERVAVGKAAGLKLRSVLDELNSVWPDKYPDLFSLLRENPPYRLSPAPGTVRHRYFLEDLPYGVEVVVNIAKAYGVDVPYSRALVEFSRLALGEELPACGLSLSREDIEQLAGGQL